MTFDLSQAEIHRTIYEIDLGDGYEVVSIIARKRYAVPKMTVEFVVVLLVEDGKTLEAWSMNKEELKGTLGDKPLFGIVEASDVMTWNAFPEWLLDIHNEFRENILGLLEVDCCNDLPF